MTEIEDIEDVRTALINLVGEAEAADVSSDAVVGLLTAHLAALRGDVRLPLSMPPARAREFTERAGEHVGETMEVELVISESVLEELELQLQVFEGDPVRTGGNGDDD